jgi:iron complex outermembrane receptor protein
MHSLRKLKSLPCAVIGLGTAFSLQAQTPPDSTTPSPGPDQGNPQVLERFVVTGSNIASADTALAVPLSVIGQQQIQDGGVQTNALDILRKIAPSISGTGSENANISSGSTLGGSELVIHGLPALVLINGRRVAYDPADASSATSEFVDLNMIPVAAIERIEVVSGGASAIYGSDAVGGVVNVILKKDYNGWEANTHYGYSDNNGHYAERIGSIVGGVSDGKTSVTVSAEYSQSDPITFANRPYTNPYYATVYYPGIIDIYNAATGNDEYYKLSGGHNAPPGGAAYTIDQLVSMGYYTDLGSAANAATIQTVEDGFNLATHQSLQQANKRQSATVDFERRLMGDKLVAFGDVIYSHTVTQSSLNAQPDFPYVSTPDADLIEYGVTPPAPGTEYVPVTSPGNPFSAAFINQGVSDGSAGYGVLAHTRFVQFPRLFENDSSLYRIEGGLRGKINEDFSWEMGADINRYELAYTNQNLLDTNAFIAAFASGALNPFALTQAPGVLPGDILGTAYVNYVSTLNSYDAVLRGVLLNLPAGKVSFAAGGSFTRENLTAVPDLNTADGGWVDAPTVLPFNQNRQVGAEFVEIEMPVLSRAPYAYSLDIDAAGRHEEYSGIGGSSVPKVDIKYQPFDDEFTFRASAGKSFIAPTLYALYGPVTTGSSNSITYTGANGTTYNLVQFQAVSGSNPSLQPSTSTTWTAGFVYSPRKLGNLTLTVDYFQTVQHGEVGFVDQGTIIQSVENLGAASPYANDIHFGGATGPGPSGDTPGQISSKPLNDVYIIAPYVNLGATAIKGIDASLEYQVRTASAGDFQFTAEGAFYSSYLLQILPSEDYFQYAGTASGNAFANAVGTIPRWRIYSTLDWKDRGFDVLLGYTFVPTVLDIGSGGSGSTPPVRIPSFQQVDIGVGYSFAALKLNRWLDSLSVRIGVNNAFDYMPPAAPGGIFNTQTDLATYNGAVGRMYYAEARYKF